MTAHVARHTSQGEGVRRILVLGLVGLRLLTAPAPVLAVDPTAYLTGMPSQAKVEAAFVGTSTLDTAALRFAAFVRLEAMSSIFIGARGPAGKATQAEADLHYAYINAWQAIKASVQASLPEDQRGFYIGTAFTAWSQTVSQYANDAGFAARFRTLFSSDFQSAYAAVFAQVEKDEAVPLTMPYQTAPLTGTAAILDTLKGYAPFFAWLGSYLLLFILLGPGRRAKERTAAKGRT